ncbi:unnamed protein product [Linum tenue]|uniref:Uncharacterized protein n=1 Tax=Linum tenue TaxID=586396 RepID=A0AAV0P8H3_9ROSI|nr:unnamed protein product [Linum tenue]
MGRAPCCEKVGLKKGRWTAEEDQILTSYIQQNGEGKWRSLPKNAGNCGKSCRLRWINYLRADVKRGNISKEEEETIVKLHGSLGNRYYLISLVFTCPYSLVDVGPKKLSIWSPEAERLCQTMPISTSVSVSLSRSLSVRSIGSYKPVIGCDLYQS